MERRITTNALRRYLTRRQNTTPPDTPQDTPQDATGADATAAVERCDLCGTPVTDGHRHLVDLSSRELRCACRPCATLFDRPGAGGRQYRAVPDRRWHLRGFALDDAAWDALRIPVRMAFFSHDSTARRAVLLYPSPGGAVESPLARVTWARLEAANPVLGGLTPDVEALLVDRTGDARDHWIVPIDDCYALVGLIRTHWKGLAGGPDVWREIAAFFAELRRGAATMDARGARDGNRPEGARP
ncbi:DUF5947 family protein [Microtetraspora malaysiensis]|uniref:DUF5947 family protein n=1 Tax=Microtetraspora malaysiensis TaxID=161358 RepID=UPI003D8C8172